mmetsp:Transcript_16569/g.41895  ORF Transcript_16569/g.41895 Transcript_16569/m.41895 type:complete len:210 (-) Transcript_16569:84-713(-)
MLWMIWPCSSTTAMLLMPLVAISSKPLSAGSFHFRDTAGDVMQALTWILRFSSSGATNLRRMPCVTTLLRPPCDSGPPKMPTMWLPVASARATSRRVTSSGKVVKGRLAATPVTLRSSSAILFLVPCETNDPFCPNFCWCSTKSWQMKPQESRRSRVPTILCSSLITGHARMPFPARNLNPSIGMVFAEINKGSRSIGRSPAFLAVRSP